MISSAILVVSGLVEFSTRSRIAMLLNSESMVASFRQMLGLYGIRGAFCSDLTAQVLEWLDPSEWTISTSKGLQEFRVGEENLSCNTTCLRMLRGLCDGEILLDSNLRVVGKSECLRTPSSCRHWFSCANNPDHLRIIFLTLEQKSRISRVWKSSCTLCFVPCQSCCQKQHRL